MQMKEGIWLRLTTQQVLVLWTVEGTGDEWVKLRRNNSRSTGVLASLVVALSTSATFDARDVLHGLAMGDLHCIVH